MLSKPANKLKFLIRGGSIAAGRGVSRSYVDILKDNPLLKDIDIILSAGNGHTTFDCIWDFEQYIGKYNPDILLLHFGIDDIYLPVYRSEFKENLVQTVRLAVQFNPYIILMTSQPFRDKYEMESANIYYRAIREVAVDLKCDLIPIHLYWANYLYENRYYHRDFIQNDNRYPNEKGHEIFASAVMQKMEMYLSRQ